MGDAVTRKEALGKAAPMSAKSRLCMVTTNLNYGDYLDDCMRSIVHSRAADRVDRVDYVVMDAGSTDNSLDIVKKYEPHLKHWQSVKDVGMYHAIEEGFKHSDGPLHGLPQFRRSADPMGHPKRSRYLR